MYALAVSVKIESGKEDEAREALQTRVVPMIKEQSEGLVAGYFMEPQNGFGYSLLVFDSEENANKGAEMAKSAPRPEFVTIQNAQVMEVVESL